MILFPEYTPVVGLSLDGVLQLGNNMLKGNVMVGITRSKIYIYIYSLTLSLSLYLSFFLSVFSHVLPFPRPCASLGGGICYKATLSTCSGSTKRSGKLHVSSFASMHLGLAGGSWNCAWGIPRM